MPTNAPVRRTGASITVTEVVGRPVLARWRASDKHRICHPRDASIKALNSGFAAGIPPVSVEEIAKTDPLILSFIEPRDLSMLTRRLQMRCGVCLLAAERIDVGIVRRYLHALIRMAGGLG